MTSEGDNTCTYDAQGNLTDKAVDSTTHTYTYNAKQRLTQFSDGSRTIDFEYDADDIRVSKSIDGVKTDFIVDSNQDYQQVVAEQDAGSNITKEYLYGTDLISQSQSGLTSFYHYDSLGTTRALSSVDGSISDEYAYEAFGEITNKTGTTDNNYLYTGEQYDTELDNYYLRARYYNQGVGRFTQFDSFEGLDLYPASLHKYVYVANDPLTYTDPSGYTFLTNQLIASTIRGQIARTSASRAGISIARSKSTKQLVWDGGCFVIEDIVIGQATKIATEGVYLFSDLQNNGQPYTGQAKNVQTRTSQHANAGRAKAKAFLRSFPVTIRDNGKIKDALDILEQWVLEVLLEEAGYDKSGKIKNAPVGNQKNVIGINRPKLQKALSKAKLCG